MIVYYRALPETPIPNPIKSCEQRMPQETMPRERRLAIIHYSILKTRNTKV